MLSRSDFEFLVKTATKAPSGHNTQPWLFAQRDSAVEIRPDFGKALPAVDPSDRELFVSLGCATENLCLAAKTLGFEPKVSVDNAGKIIVALEESDSKAPDRLFDQIDKRQTNRSVYDGREIPAETILKLQEVRVENGVRIHYFSRREAEFDEIAKFVFSANELQMSSDDFKNELKSWMRFNKKHRDQTCDGLSYDVFGAPNVPRFIAEFVMTKKINADSQNESDRKKIAASSHLVLFSTVENNLRAWVNLGRTLQRFLLASTELGLAHAYLNQPNEEAEIAREMTERLKLEGEFPTILLRLGYGKAQSYSKRKDFKSVISE